MRARTLAGPVFHLRNVNKTGPGDEASANTVATPTACRDRTTTTMKRIKEVRMEIRAGTEVLVAA